MTQVYHTSLRLAASVLFLSVLSASAQADIAIHESSYDDRDAAVAYNTTSNEYLVAFYEDAGGPLFDRPVHVQRLGPDGQALGASHSVWTYGYYPIALHYNSAHDRYLLAVSYHFYVGLEAVYGVVLDGEGNKLAEPKLIDGILDPGSNFATNRAGVSPIAVAYNSIADEYLVTAQITWEDSGTDYYQIKARKVDGDGTPLGSEFSLWGPNPSTSPQSHALAYAPISTPETPTGRYLLAVGGDSLYLVNAAGDVVEIFDVPNNEPDGGDWLVGGGQSHADVAYGVVDGQPTFLVVYEDSNNMSPFFSGYGHSGVWATQVDADTLDHLAFGSMFGPFPVSSICAHSPETWTPTVQFDDARDEFAVVWRETGRTSGGGCITDVPLNHVRGQRLGASFLSLPLDNPAGENVLLSQATGTEPGNELPLHPQLALGLDGVALVAWDDARNDAVTGRDLYAGFWAGYPNDQFVKAQIVGPGAYNGSLWGATNDGATDCGDSASSPDVWYYFTAPSDGELRVTTCGSNDLPGTDLGVDTVLSLHEAGSPDVSIPDMCNDDWALGPYADACEGVDLGNVRDSALVYNMTSGQTVWIRVSLYDGSTPGDFILNVAFGDGIPGDIDGDGDVDQSDLGTLLAAYGSCTGDPTWNPDADINNDGCIDQSDLGELLANYGS